MSFSFVFFVYYIIVPPSFFFALPERQKFNIFFFLCPSKKNKKKLIFVVKVKCRLLYYCCNCVVIFILGRHEAVNEVNKCRHCWIKKKKVYIGEGRKLKRKDGLKFTKMGEKLGGCSWQGGLKKFKKFKNLPLQVPPKKCVYT